MQVFYGLLMASSVNPSTCPGGGTRQIHKITSEWDSRKGALLWSSFLVFQTLKHGDQTTKLGIIIN